MTTHQVTASGVVRSSGSATASVIRFQERILDAARYISTSPTAGDPAFAASVIIAQTACEVAAQRAVEFLIDARNLGSLGEAIEGYVSKYSFTDDRLQAMWTSLTGDAIQYAAFWARYKTHVKRRNSAAHRGLDEDGQQMTKAKAEDSIEVADLFLAHIKDVLTKNGLAHLA